MNSEIKLTPEIYNKCFAYGELKGQPFYVNTFGIYPNIHIYSIDGEFNLAKVDLSKLLKDFKGTLITLISSYEECVTSCVEDNEDDNKVNETVVSGLRFITDNREYITIDTDTITYYYESGDPNKFIEKILKYLPQEEDISESANVKLVCRDDSDYYTITSKIEPTNTKLEENYNDDFLPVYNDLVKFIDERTSGIAILRGKIGTGKKLPS